MSTHRQTEPNTCTPISLDQTPTVELGGSQTFHGATFNHIEGDYNYYHIPRQPTTRFDEQGLKTLFQYIATEAMHNSAERYPPPKCLADTRSHILAELTNWIQHPHQSSSILWFHAPAGHGKSAILQTIAELLSSPKGRVVANFFFGRGKGKREEARYLFTTIAYQLALYVPGLRDHVDQIVHADPTLPTNAMSFQVDSLIVDAFSRLDISKVPEMPFTVIIDGLDECSDYEAQQSIIELLEQMTTINHLPLRFLISSRPEPQIREVFNRPNLRQITCRVVLSDNFRSRSDIKKFLRHGFSDIYRRKSHQIRNLDEPWPSKEVIRFLCAKSSGQFIYATTVLKFINDRFKLPGAQLDIILSSKVPHRNPFSDLDTLYFQILSTYPDAETLTRLLGFIIVLSSPVTAAVYEDLLGFDLGEVELILQGMHSLLGGVPHGDFHGDGISIPHASFRDFLTQEHRSGQYYVDTRKFNSELVAASFSVLLGSRTDPDPLTLAFLRSGLKGNFLKLDSTALPQSISDMIPALKTKFHEYDLRGAAFFKLPILYLVFHSLVKITQMRSTSESQWHMQKTRLLDALAIEKHFQILGKVTDMTQPDADKVAIFEIDSILKEMAAIAAPFFYHSMAAAVKIQS